MSVADFAYAAVSLVDATVLLFWGAHDLHKWWNNRNDPALQSYRRDGMFLLILGTCTLAAYGLGHYREVQTSETIAKTNALAEQSRTENLRLTKQIEEERTRRAMIELRLAARRLDIAQYELIVATLRRFRGQKLNVLLYAEAEPHLYGEAIIKALTEANWNLHVVRP